MNLDKFDLSKENCHVCGNKLLRNFKDEKEYCGNGFCQVYGIKFTIPYKLKAKSEATLKRIHWIKK